MMLNIKFWRWILRVSFSRVYPDNKKLVDEVNSETWLGAQIETGGHALSKLKPIGDYEAISIRAAISNSKSCIEGSVSTTDIDYWEKNWKS